MILPSYLVQLGYEAIPIVQALDTASFIERNDHIDIIKPWYDLRDIFEYISCVEYARQQLLQLPAGRAIGSINIVSARYHSASLVFFSQATLDNLSIWLNNIHNCGLKGTSISFYKNQIKPLLIATSKDYGKILSKHEPFIKRLNSYRMEWLHRLAGGAEIYSDKNLSDPDANISIQIPIDPTIPSLRSSPEKYFKKIQKVQRENRGKWLMPVSQFANEIADETISLCFEMLEISLQFKGKV